MVTLKEYEACLRVKTIIDSCDEAEIISKLSNERNYTPMIIELEGINQILFNISSTQPNIIQHQQRLDTVG